MLLFWGWCRWTGRVGTVAVVVGVVAMTLISASAFLRRMWRKITKVTSAIGPSINPRKARIITTPTSVPVPKPFPVPWALITVFARAASRAKIATPPPMTVMMYLLVPIIPPFRWFWWLRRSFSLGRVNQHVYWLSSSNNDRISILAHRFIGFQGSQCHCSFSAFNNLSSNCLQAFGFCFAPGYGGFRLADRTKCCCVALRFLHRFFADGILNCRRTPSYRFDIFLGRNATLLNAIAFKRTP